MKHYIRRIIRNFNKISYNLTFLSRDILNYIKNSKIEKLNSISLPLHVRYLRISLNKTPNIPHIFSFKNIPPIVSPLQQSTRLCRYALSAVSLLHPEAEPTSSYLLSIGTESIIKFLTPIFTTLPRFGYRFHPCQKLNI